nr:hypothetical protein BaRGS_014907 [Batillaria attramentaria]
MITGLIASKIKPAVNFFLFSSTEFTAEYIDSNPKHLLLTCSTRHMSPDSQVISIKIYNRTTSHTLAWVTSTGSDEGHPKFSNASASRGRYISGTLKKGDLQNSRLELLFMNNDASTRAFYGCTISVMGHLAKIEDIELAADTEINTDGDNGSRGGVRRRFHGCSKENDKSLPTGPMAHPLWVGADLGTTENETVVRTGNAIQPTVLNGGVPMSVMIALVVLLTVLTLVTSALLLHKCRGRCCAPDLPYPPSPHYAIAGDGFEGGWEEKMAMKGSRPSLHNLAMLRSHYSLPRPLQPPPPPPKLHRTKSRESRENSEYLASSLRAPPGMTRSMYTMPYDAIVQDCPDEADLSLLNTSGHDLTPSLPPEQAGEASLYKVPRAEAQVQTHGQGHDLYSSGPAMNGHLPGLQNCPDTWGVKDKWGVKDTWGVKDSSGLKLTLLLASG